MSYLNWFKKHSIKHKEIVEKLSLCSSEEIIDYFDFANMVEKEFNFCPLYTKDKKCHNMKKLNCYLCGCPYFRFNENGFREIEGKKLYSYCSIDSKNARDSKSQNAIHLDCSGCNLPHTQKFIGKNFSMEWEEIMKSV